MLKKVTVQRTKVIKETKTHEKSSNKDKEPTALAQSAKTGEEHKAEMKSLGRAPHVVGAEEARKLGWGALNITVQCFATASRG